jgi:hypothetical protein
MARKQEIVRPFYDVRAEYENSLMNYVQKASMLANAVANALSIDSKIPSEHRMNSALREALQEALDGFEDARMTR